MKRMQAKAGSPKQIGQLRGPAAFAALLLAAASAQGASAGAAPDQDGAARAASATPSLKHALVAKRPFKRVQPGDAALGAAPEATANTEQTPLGPVLPGTSKFARRRMRFAEAVAADPAAL